MRIAIINWSSRLVGGIETYLNALIPELVNAGNEVSFFCEADEPVEREQITLAPAIESWCASALGSEQALQALRNWKPDVLYTHKLDDPELEAEIMAIAPAVFFAHDYHGMCISGTKTHQFPIARPCDRRLGAACLLHYFPRRCGGLNPISMMRLYRLQTRRTDLLPRYDAVVTHSDYMRGELIKHGVSPQRAHSFPFLTEARRGARAEVDCGPTSNGDSTGSNESAGVEQSGQLQLIFCGRMEVLKGGHILLDALPEVQKTLGKKVRLVFAGDGRRRSDWERQAAQLQGQHDSLDIEFVGWLDRPRLERLIDSSDLMVVPSLWPEPFGLSGPEAGLRGLPAVAFAVGGISEWLENGVNGCLAPGDPPTAKGLAEAIIRCVNNQESYEELRRGSVKLAQRFNGRSHLAHLMKVFNGIVSPAAIAS
jgi:glycosyltransferase involved in cell wall biosynthesis